jgi:hypothetical protein
LIKIDVEGYEREVLTGIEALFQRGAAPSVIVEMHPGRHDRDAGSFVVDFCLRHALRLSELVKPSSGAHFGLRLRERPMLRDVPARHCTLLLSRP